MKRHLIIILCTLFSCQAIFAQNLARRTENDITLQAATDYWRKAGSIGVALTYELNKPVKEETFLLSLWVISKDLKFAIDKKSKMLIRTTRGQIIELEQTTESPEQQSKYLGLSGGVSHYYYYVYPDYLITRQDLETIMKDGVSKIRLETTVGMMDYPYSVEIVGEMLTAEYGLIFNNKNFDTDF